MAFTIPEGLADFPEALALVNKIATLSWTAPAGEEARIYATNLATVLPELGVLIDKIRKQAAD